MVLGLGGEAEAAGDFADLEAAVAVGVVGDELVEEGTEVVAELAGGEFLVGGEGFGAGSGVVGIRGRGFPGLRSETWGTRFGAGWGFEDLGGVGGLGVQGVGVFKGLDCVVVGLLVFEGERVLLGGEGVEFGLALFAEQAGELGERDRLFGCVDDSFDLGFKTHGCRVECINPAPMMV